QHPRALSGLLAFDLGVARHLELRADGDLPAPLARGELDLLDGGERDPREGDAAERALPLEPDEAEEGLGEILRGAPAEQRGELPLRVALRVDDEPEIDLVALVAARDRGELRDASVREERHPAAELGRDAARGERRPGDVGVDPDLARAVRV